MVMQARKQSVDCRPAILRRRIGTTGYDVICSRLMAASMFVSLLAMSTAGAAIVTSPHLDNISGERSPGEPSVLGADKSKMAAVPERLVVVLQAFDRKDGDSDATQWNSYGDDNKVDQRRPTRTGSTSSREKVRDMVPIQRKQKSSEAASSASSTQQEAVFSLPTRGDCHRLNRLEATAAVFRRTREQRSRPRGAAHSDSDEDEALVENNQQLLAELRRRFADNRTIVLCKPLSTVRTQSGIVNRLPETSSFDTDDGSNDKMTSRSHVSASLRNRVATGTLLRRDLQHRSEDKNEDDIPPSSLSERRRYETMPNDLTSMSADVMDNNLPLAFPFPFPHRKRHSQRGSRTRRHGDRGRNSHNDSVHDDDGYFRCSGRQYPSTLRYFRRLESAMRACDCWIDEDERLATDVYGRLSSLRRPRLSGAPMTPSEMNSVSQLQQLQCSFQRRYQACRLEMMPMVGRGGGRRRTGSDVSATRRGLPYSWSQQVSDIMNPKKNISMIFY